MYSTQDGSTSRIIIINIIIIIIIIIVIIVIIQSMIHTCRYCCAWVMPFRTPTMFGVKVHDSSSQ